jgi:hypothetical protein
MPDVLSIVNAPVLAVVPPIGPGAANVAPSSVAALTALLHVKPALVVHVSAFAAVLHGGIANAVGLAVEALAFARTVFAACVARSAVVTSPVAVKLLVTVGLLMLGDAIVGDVERTGEPEPVAAFARPVATPAPRPETPLEIGRPAPFDSVTAEGVPRFGATSAGEFESTAEPVPVAVVAPVPPFAAVSGFWSVRLLNVGEGYVWASATIGARSAEIRSFFIGRELADTDRPAVIPGDASSSGLFSWKVLENAWQNERYKHREGHRAFRELAALHLVDGYRFRAAQRLREPVNFHF